MSDTPPPASEPPRGFAGAGPASPPDLSGPVPPARPSSPVPARRRRKAWPLIVCLLAAVAVVAVIVVSWSGDDGGSGLTADGTPGAAVVWWTTAMADPDYDAACAAMADQSIQLIAANGPTCPEALATMDPEGRYEHGDEAEVTGTTTEGDRSEVTIVLGGSDGTRRVVVARKEDGRWKASPFEATGASGPTTTEVTGAEDPRDDIDEATATVCQVQIDSTQTAADAYAALNGEPPADLDALVDGGFLTERPDGVAIDDGIVSGTGDCA